MTQYVIQGGSQKYVYVADEHMRELASDPTNNDYRFAEDDEVIEHFEGLVKLGVLDSVPQEFAALKRARTRQRKQVADSDAGQDASVTSQDAE